MDDLRTIFAGRRGRLLAGLLFAEFAAAVDGIAYVTVLPLAAGELSGASLYGATLAADSFAMILILAMGPRPLTRFRPVQILFMATLLYTLGSLSSALAPAMWWILLGTVLRGVASGLLAGFGLSAIGGLYEDALRPRVLGMFAIVWLGPSIAGPILNGGVASVFGWRVALAWPVVIILVARFIVGRHASMVPWERSEALLRFRSGAVVLAGLGMASAAPLLEGPFSILLFVAGILISILAGRRIIQTFMGGDSNRTQTSIAFAGLCLTFFGGSALVPLFIVEVLDAGPVAVNIAYGLGLVAWALTGFRASAKETRFGDLSRIGLNLMAANFVILSAAAFVMSKSQNAFESWRLPALVAIAVCWLLAGLGMGLAYPRLSARAFNAAAPSVIPVIAVGVAFAETSAVAVGALLGGGLYSLAGLTGRNAGSSLSLSLLLLAAVGVLSHRVQRRTKM